MLKLYCSRNMDTIFFILSVSFYIATATMVDQGPCVKFSLVDTFGDGWERSNLQVFDKSGLFLSSHPTSATEPTEFSYCFDASTTSDGDTVVATALGLSPSFPWEVYWTATIEETGETFTGTFKTLLAFQYHNLLNSRRRLVGSTVSQQITLQYSENLLPNTKSCLSCQGNPTQSGGLDSVMKASIQYSHRHLISKYMPKIKDQERQLSSLSKSTNKGAKVDKADGDSKSKYVSNRKESKSKSKSSQSSASKTSNYHSSKKSINPKESSEATTKTAEEEKGENTGDQTESTSSVPTDANWVLHQSSLITLTDMEPSDGIQAFVYEDYYYNTTDVENIVTADEEISKYAATSDSKVVASSSAQVAGSQEQASVSNEVSSVTNESFTISEKAPITYNTRHIRSRYRKKDSSSSVETDQSTKSKSIKGRKRYTKVSIISTGVSSAVGSDKDGSVVTSSVLMTSSAVHSLNGYGTAFDVCSSDGQQLLYSGAVCGDKTSSECGFSIPEGTYVWRVSGAHDELKNEISWDFCGINGGAMTEMTLQINHDGSCTPLAMVDYSGDTIQTTVFVLESSESEENNLDTNKTLDNAMNFLTENATNFMAGDYSENADNITSTLVESVAGTVSGTLTIPGYLYSNVDKDVVNQLKENFVMSLAAVSSVDYYKSLTTADVSIDSVSAVSSTYETSLYKLSVSYEVAVSAGLFGFDEDDVSLEDLQTNIQSYLQQIASAGLFAVQLNSYVMNVWVYQELDQNTVLCDLYTSTNMLLSSSGWGCKDGVPRSSPCEGSTSFWTGVTCANNVVSGITISGMDITGTLPETLGGLKSLTLLAVQNTQIDGSLPSTLGYLSNLSVLEIFYNSISGTIPSTFGLLNNLKMMELYVNNLEGTIPQSFGRLTGLEVLDIAMNSFTGTIPETFGYLKELRFLGIDGNTFSGTVPAALCDAPISTAHIQYMSEKMNTFTCYAACLASIVDFNVADLASCSSTAPAASTGSANSGSSDVKDAGTVSDSTSIVNSTDVISGSLKKSNTSSGSVGAAGNSNIQDAGSTTTFDDKSAAPTLTPTQIPTARPTPTPSIFLRNSWRDNNSMYSGSGSGDSRSITNPYQAMYDLTAKQGDPCVVFTVADTFGDGWGSAKLHIFDTHGVHDIVQPTLQSSGPEEMEYCFTSTSVSGDTLGAAVMGLSASYHTSEVYWTAKNMLTGDVYTGTYMTYVTFQYNVRSNSDGSKTQSITLFAAESLQANEKSCTQCTQTQLSSESAVSSGVSLANVPSNVNLQDIKSRIKKTKSHDVSVRRRLTDYSLFASQSDAWSSLSGYGTGYTVTDLNSGKVVFEGSKCGGTTVEDTCTLSLAAGTYVWRVSGATDESKGAVSWDFCSVHGGAMTEVIFEIDEYSDCTPLDVNVYSGKWPESTGYSKYLNSATNKQQSSTNILTDLIIIHGTMEIFGVTSSDLTTQQLTLLQSVLTQDIKEAAIVTTSTSTNINSHMNVTITSSKSQTSYASILSHEINFDIRINPTSFGYIGDFSNQEILTEIAFDFERYFQFSMQSGLFKAELVQLATVYNVQGFSSLQSVTVHDIYSECFKAVTTASWRTSSARVAEKVFIALNDSFVMMVAMMGLGLAFVLVINTKQRRLLLQQNHRENKALFVDENLIKPSPFFSAPSFFRSASSAANIKSNHKKSHSIRKLSTKSDGVIFKTSLAFEDDHDQEEAGVVGVLDKMIDLNYQQMDIDESMEKESKSLPMAIQVQGIHEMLGPSSNRSEGFELNGLTKPASPTAGSGVKCSRSVEIDEDETGSSSHSIYCNEDKA